MDVYKLPIHPLAKKFPKMQKEEFSLLVESIKDMGLREPLMLAEVDGKTMVIDGINRLAACKEAKLAEVPTTMLNGGASVEDYILAANLARRNLTVGQQAILHAWIAPEGAKGGRGQKNPALEAPGFPGRDSRKRARFVVKHADDLARKVMAGTDYSLPQAYADAKTREAELQGSTERMDALRAEAADLAERVASDTDGLTLDEAWLLLKQAREDRRNRIKTDCEALRTIVARVGSTIKTSPVRKNLIRELTEYDQGEVEKFLGDITLRKMGAALREAGNAAIAMAEEIKNG